jgi:predicted acylesterase/phospholipase RssA
VADRVGSSRRPHRSLILAGGGVKVAFQAGVLQVLLDEAEGLEFHHFDGASGGTFNLAMLCQGLSGREIADNWRRFAPLRIVQPNPRIVLGESIARLDRLRDDVFADWGLDWNAIRASQVNATFNVYDFSRHEHLVLEPDEMNADMLVACVSLPMWFPPVESGGETLIDPVYITDANVEEAIKRGADELWVIWTVSRRARWRRGFVNQYFQIIEVAAYGHFKRILRRIEESNAALAAGRHAEFDRPISVKVLYAEVPLHYLINVSRRRFRRAAEMGVEAGREWCRREGVALRHPPKARGRDPQTLEFTEEMAGAISLGQSDPDRGYQSGRKSGSRLKFHLTMQIDDLDVFLSEPQHEAAAHGYVESAVLGGRLPVQHGLFNLFTDTADPRLKLMRYRLFFSDSEGRDLTLAGLKYIQDDPGSDAWSDTTTLYVQILEGHVTQLDHEDRVIAAGILRISPLALIRQLLTFRGTGPGLFGDTWAVLRFNWAFTGQLFKAYGKKLLRGG